MTTFKEFLECKNEATLNENILNKLKKLMGLDKQPKEKTHSEENADKREELSPEDKALLSYRLTKILASVNKLINVRKITDSSIEYNFDTNIDQSRGGYSGGQFGVHLHSMLRMYTPYVNITSDVVKYKNSSHTEIDHGIIKYEVTNVKVAEEDLHKNKYSNDIKILHRSEPPMSKTPMKTTKSGKNSYTKSTSDDKRYYDNNENDILDDVISAAVVYSVMSSN